MTVKVRFAPSPTGKLHVGNVRTALANWLYAKAYGGRFVLRIDDTDLERSTKAYEDGIQADLTWLGMTWNEKDNQSARFPIYQQAVERLKAQGRLYPAYDTGEELERRRRLALAQHKPPIYDRAALKLSKADIAALEAEGRRPHWRFKLDGKRVHWDDLVRGRSEVDTASMSDPVLIREDGAFLYTLPSVADDVDMEITHVIRGEDHVTNTGAQIEVFEALGAKPPKFAHMPLLVGADGEALSKRLGSLSIEQLREGGFEPIAVLSHLAKIGTSDALEIAADLGALAATFEFGKMGRAPARYDSADLERLNAAALHAMSYAEAQPRLAERGADLGEAFWLAIRANLTLFDGVATWVRVISGPVDVIREDPDFLIQASSLLPETLDAGSWSAWTNAVKEATGRKGKALFLPLRQALTGLEHGPEMGPLLPLIGRDAALARLQGRAS